MALTPLVGFSPRTPRPYAPISESGFDYTLPANADLAVIAAHDPVGCSKLITRRHKVFEQSKRMVSPRMARIGLDVAGLNAQVAAKQAAATAEEQSDKYYVRQQELSLQIEKLKEDIRQQQEREQKKNWIDSTPPICGRRTEENTTC